MKFASYKNGRDGRLMVVSRDLSKAIAVPDIAPTLQHALDNWEKCEHRLQDISDDLNAGKISGDAFAPEKCAAPLPRAYQWLDASTYRNHIELARTARGAEMPPELETDPLMYQGGSDGFLGPCDDIRFESEDYGIDFEAEVAIVTGDVKMATPAEKTGDAIRLLMLVNDVSLRYIAQKELAKGFGFVQAKPATAFSPVAVTPDELGRAWKGCKVNLPMQASWNDTLYGHPDAGEGSLFNFAQLISHAAKTRDIGAGTIIGSGTVSNKDRSKGHCCIVEKRMIEKIETGKSVTGFMKFGDTVKIEMLDADGASIFGAIRQKVVRL